MSVKKVVSALMLLRSSLSGKPTITGFPRYSGLSRCSMEQRTHPYRHEEYLGGMAFISACSPSSPSPQTEPCAFGGSFHPQVSATAVRQIVLQSCRPSCPPHHPDSRICRVLDDEWVLIVTRGLKAGRMQARFGTVTESCMNINCEYSLIKDN